MSVKKPSSGESIQTIKDLIGNGLYEKAGLQCSELLKKEPDQAQVLYLHAIAQRHQGQNQAALKTLAHYQKKMPESGLGYQEQGLNEMAGRHLVQSIGAFEKAVSLNSALIDSWNALIGLYTMSKNARGIQNAQMHFNSLKALPKPLLEVNYLISEDELIKAEQLCRKYLQKNPKHVEAMRLLAAIAYELGVFDDAEILLESALEFEPNYHRVRFDYVNVLIRSQNFEAAFKHAKWLKDAEPENYNYLRLYANVCTFVGRKTEAIELYQKLLELDADNHNIYLSLGHAYKTVGQMDNSISSYQSAYTEKPGFGDAYWSLANLKTYQLTDKEVEAAEQAEASCNVAEIDKMHLCFALGKAYEDRGEPEPAFDYYLRGNQLGARKFEYDESILTTELSLAKETFTHDFFEKVSGSGCNDRAPVFIVGMPRAGSTLIEQILASHSMVDGTFELPNILSLVRHLNGRRDEHDEAHYPGIVATLSADSFAEMGESYIRDTQVHRLGAPFFTDKMPNNFRHIGLIKAILPNAKIIDARRNAMACCFSCFKQLFAEGQAYTYDLKKLGRYYSDYVAMMDHWDEVLPGQILRVQYEDVVADIESQVERMLAFCDLPMEKECLDFYKTSRSVQTPSSEQVRQPINNKGLAQWESFEPFLGALKEALGGRQN